MLRCAAGFVTGKERAPRAGRDDFGASSGSGRDAGGGWQERGGDRYAQRGDRGGDRGGDRYGQRSDRYGDQQQQGGRDFGYAFFCVCSVALILLGNYSVIAPLTVTLAMLFCSH